MRINATTTRSACDRRAPAAYSPTVLGATVPPQAQRFNKMPVTIAFVNTEHVIAERGTRAERPASPRSFAITRLAAILRLCSQRDHELQTTRGSMTDLDRGRLQFCLQHQRKSKFWAENFFHYKGLLYGAIAASAGMRLKTEAASRLRTEVDVVRGSSFRGLKYVASK